MNLKKHRLLLSVLLAFPVLGNANQSTDPSLDLLMSMSLEELSLLDVTMETASKSSQSISEIPAAVYVLDGERILRSGVRNIAEALALIPGMYVSKWNENSYHVSTRGFHDGLYNKMLVMIDGRSIYSPIYGGVYWGNVDYLLSDIERIEVLRGPSGAIWGGNAATSVVNIITKSPESTLGTHVTSTFGQYGDYDAGVRHGVQFNESVTARAFYKQKSEANYLDNDAKHKLTQSAGIVLAGNASSLEWHLDGGGSKSTYDTIFASVAFSPSDPNLYYSPAEVTYGQREVLSESSYVQLKVTKPFENGNSLTTKVWLDHAKDTAADAPGEYMTADLDVHYNYRMSSDHNLLIGLGLRHQEIEFGVQPQTIDRENTEGYGRFYNIETSRDQVSNIYAQSDYQWTDRVKTILGVKGEYFTQNDTFELSPQLRTLWKINNQHSLWAGVGRAVMAPSYMNSNGTYYSTDIRHELGGGYLDVYLPNEDLSNESVVTYEAGYRFKLNPSFNLEVNAFYSDHQHLRGQHFTGVENGYIYTYQVSDEYEASTYGLELGGQYAFNESLNAYFSYSYLSVDIQDTSQNENGTGYEMVYSIPHQHIASMQAQWDITASLQWDIIVKYQDTTYTDDYYDLYSGSSSINISDVDKLWTFDTRIGWQHNPHYPLVELIAQKLGQDDEYDSWSLYPNEERVQVRVSHDF